MNLPGFALRHKPVVISLVICVVVLGIQAFLNAPRREDPEFKIRDAVITCEWPGATAEQVEKHVSDKIEAQMLELKEILRITSTSAAGRAVIGVRTLQSIADPDPVWSKVKAELKLVTPQLPKGCKEPWLNDKFGDAAAMVLAMYQDPEGAKRRKYTAAELENYAKKLRDALMDLRPLKENEKGEMVPLTTAPSYIARLEMYGVRKEVIYLETDGGRWSQLGLTADKLRAALDERNVVAPAGQIDGQGNRLVMRLTGNFDAENEVKRVVVGRVATGAENPVRMTASEFVRQMTAGLSPKSGRSPEQEVPVYLDDVGITVTRDYQDPPAQFCRYGGPEFSADAIILSFTMKGGMNITDLGGAVEDLLATANETLLPPDIRVAKIADQPLNVEKKISEVIGNLVDSVLIVLVVLLFLAGWRVALICALAIPMIMLMAMGLMGFFGCQLEQISLAALIISLGILVDNAIQVSDNTQRFMGEGLAPDDAATQGPLQIAFPLLIATGTILAAFLPMLISYEASTKEYIFSLPVVVSLALGGGWIFSMTATPVMARAILRSGGGKPPLMAFAAWLKSKFGKGEADGEKKSGYQKLLGIAIAGKYVTIALAVGYLFAMVTFAKVASSFFPDADTPQFVVDWTLPTGVPIHAADDVGRRVETVVRAMSSKTYDENGNLVDFKDEDGKPTERLKAMGSYIGTGGPRFYMGLNPKSGGPNYGILCINAVNPIVVPQYVEDVRRAVNEGIGEPGDEGYVPPVSGARVVAKRLVMGTPVDSPVGIRVMGPRLGSEKVLRRFAQPIKDAIEDSGIAWDVYDSWGEPLNQLDVNVEPDAANMAGVTNAAVANTLNAYYTGHYLTSYREGDKQIPIMLRLPPGERRSIRELDQSYVEGYSGKVPLDAVADLEWRLKPGRVERYQRARTITINAMPYTGYFASEVISHPTVQAALTKVEEELPPGYRLELGGIDEEAAKSAAQAATSMAITAILIILLLIIQYNSFSKPMMILLTVPLAIVSGTFGLALMNLPMGFMETLGYIALLGIVLSAAILMVDFSARLIAKKLEDGEDLAPEGERSYSGLTREAFRSTLAKAANMRLMPIMMTTLTTVGGLAPLMFGTNPLFKGLATVVVVGLSLGTLMTLFVLPAIIAFFVETFRVHMAKDADPALKEELTP